MASKTRKTLIVATTDRCNLDCIYCRIPSKNLETMSDTTLENLTSKIANYNSRFGSTSIIWHGNEPLTAGLQFYEKAVALQKVFAPDHKFENSMQTNGTLLNDSYIKFFAENGFHLGISLDGIAETHNLNRPDKHGNPTYKKVISGFEAVRANHLGGGVICVVNRNNVDRLDEIYLSFKEQKIQASFLPQLPEGNGAISSDLVLSAAEYGQAMCRLFDQWYNDHDEPIISLDPFNIYLENTPKLKNLFAALSREPLLLDYFKNLFPGLEITNINFLARGMCDMTNSCFASNVGISVSGDIYPCARFFDDPLFCYGNINQCSFEDAESKFRATELHERATKGVELCKACDVIEMCNSGCPQAAYVYTGSVMSKDPFCEAYKLIITHINQTVETGG